MLPIPLSHELFSLLCGPIAKSEKGNVNHQFTDIVYRSIGPLIEKLDEISTFYHKPDTRGKQKRILYEDKVVHENMDVLEELYQRIIANPKWNMLKGRFQLGKGLITGFGQDKYYNEKYGVNPIIIPSNASELKKKLCLLIGTIQAGNNNTTILPELTAILDELLKQNEINKRQYKQIYYRVKKNINV